MKMVVLDGYTLNPGDNPWSPVEALGSLTVYDRTSPADLLRRCEGCEVVFTNKTPLTAETIAALPALKLICVLATGYNVVDISAAAARGIPVCNVPAYGTDAVAELVFALMLELARRVGLHAVSVLSGGWSAQPDYSYWCTPQSELRGKVLGIVGYGRIGRRVAEIGTAFGMKLLISTPHPSAEGAGAFVPLSELLQQADFVSLHCPFTKENGKLMNSSRIALMKPSAFLINTARGQLVDEQALADALNQGRIAGAALDVLSSEPPAADNPLLSAKNVIITPHIAWATLEARRRLMTVAAQNVASWSRGVVINRVN